MQFRSLLLASASAGFAIAAPNPSVSKRINFPTANWCNNGWGGDGECEKQGWHTYCCRYSYATKGGFVTWRDVKQQGADGDGFITCYLDPYEDYHGFIMCA
ncbi:hypothetical protein E4U11_000457 [Claviceps purpurea]|nr:hypothetical protein E4U37_007927 [Claviceps purpurea]KAG6165457.1 hypothetical protein E4U11_000457 [Claviceps purpurea]